jgi:hypothetical protein
MDRFRGYFQLALDGTIVKMNNLAAQKANFPKLGSRALDHLFLAELKFLKMG